MYNCFTFHGRFILNNEIISVAWDKYKNKELGKDSLLLKNGNTMPLYLCGCSSQKFPKPPLLANY